MVANVVRYRYRSAIREIGKVLEISATSLDRLAKLISHDRWCDEVIRQAGLDPGNPALRHLIPLVEEIQDFPRHLSIHPGGFLLGHCPVHNLVPIENASMEGRTVIRWVWQSRGASRSIQGRSAGIGSPYPSSPLLRSPLEASSAKAFSCHYPLGRCPHL